MKDWRETFVSPSVSIVDAIKIIDQSALQIALVVGENNLLLGTVTDGDIRRGILKGVSLEQPVTEIMKKDPIIAGPDLKREDIFNLMKENKVNQLPVVDNKGCVVRLELLGDLLEEQSFDNWVVLMVGGLGTRLQKLTEDCPKPMLKVGEKPLLETILNGFIEQGFKKFYLAVNYKGEMIREYFGDGAKWGAEVKYIVEDERKGTAGALGLLSEKPDSPLIVMNGDLLTKVNYKQLLDFHEENKASATMCVRDYSFQIPYGIVKTDHNRLVEINEKPVHHFFVNAGIYVLEPDILDLVPSDQYFDMTTLFNKAMDQEKETVVFPIREYWIDVGHYKEYEQANTDFEDVFLND